MLSFAQLCPLITLHFCIKSTILRFDVVVYVECDNAEDTHM